MCEAPWQIAGVFSFKLFFFLHTRSCCRHSKKKEGAVKKDKKEILELIFSAMTVWL